MRKTPHNNNSNNNKHQQQQQQKLKQKLQLPAHAMPDQPQRVRAGRGECASERGRERYKEVHNAQNLEHAAFAK